MTLKEEVEELLKTDREKDARDLIIKQFNSETDNSLKEPLNAEDEIKLIKWINKKTDLFSLTAELKKFYYRKWFLTESDLKNYTIQSSCSICGQKLRNIFSIRIPPATYQTTSDFKRKFKALISDAPFVNSGQFKGSKSLYIKFVFILNNGKDKDVDNMAKITLDALKNKLFDDDYFVSHLESIKLSTVDLEDHISVQISNCPLNVENKILFNSNAIGWAGMKKLK